ncbi:hypothetical protein SODALDRAFT_332102 [Sodiomyces alkalinus F11]|uniref:Rhodopsin domain-containing protein n=1 Tax=Sodiomyces alkalinus (strain CBS 110278 / VKM F-3762 / F11) TaxID=1314773 RepID=A0A3N2PZJ9_SODAK|nr:hypothetical protein SODALDRAFT_332102 [Sodiomyces alkalinus F11]ROT39951.1 hypothetical protein SODALDRAFT_332102 [Sodiomyces alkalinus F11]
MAESQGPTVVAVAIIFAVVSFLTIVLRLLSRILVIGRLSPDDWLICIAVVLSWAFIGCNIASVQYGLGSHFPDVEARGIDNMITYLQIVWMSSIFYNACLGFIKVSVLALYMRLGDRPLRNLSIVMTGVIICQAGANVLACIFQCAPISAAYDVRIPEDEKTCVHINAFYLANAAVNILTDILTYTLPIPLIFKLQVSRQQRISLMVIFGLGLFACISSVIRITYIPGMLHSGDPTWDIARPMYWSVIETNIGILAASIPSYKPLAKRYAPRLLGSSAREGKLSGFKMMPYGKSTGSRKDGIVDGERVNVSVGAKGESRFTTHTKPCMQENSSEEELFAPSGRIGVKTEIFQGYEEATTAPRPPSPLAQVPGHQGGTVKKGSG